MLWLTLALGAVVLAVAWTASAGGFEQPLISADRNLHLGDWEISHPAVTPGSHPWSVRQRRLHGGPQEGVDVVTVETEKLRLRLCPTRGMNILDVRSGDLRLGWDSPVPEVVHPSQVNLRDRGGLGFLRGFNEWLARCGLENVGAPGTEAFTDATGSDASVELTLHGRVANIPASEVTVAVDPDPPHVVRVRGEVRERSVFGPKLDLTTELAVEPGTTRIELTDTVTNRGGVAQDFQLLYHTNFGPPLLGEGSRLLAPLDSVQPIDAHAAEGIDAFSRCGPPQPGFTEQVYLARPRADETGRSVAALVDPTEERAVSVEVATEVLPCFTFWKYTAAEADGYVVGLEPGTSFPFPRNVERGQGRVPRLDPGASCRFPLAYEVHPTASAVQTLRDRVDRIQASRPPAK